jgi:hypothetical protein
MEGTAVSGEQHQSHGVVASTAVVEAPAAPPPAALVVPGRVSALTRAQAATSQLGPQLQYQLARLGPFGQSGLAALLAAAVFAASTLIPARDALHVLSANLAHAQHPAITASATQAAPRLIESLPTRGQIPAVVGTIYTQAKQTGVALDSGHYVYSPAKAGGMASYNLDFPVKASYPDIRDFINHTLTAVPAAALDKLHVERKAVGDPLVNADIGFTVFVRGE